MSDRHDTIIVGAGQAGLSLSYYLALAGHEHVILDSKPVGQIWHARRWDSFTLLTPNWMLRLPGVSHPEPPDEFLSRSETVAFLEAYARRNRPPLATGHVTGIRAAPAGGYELIGSNRTWSCRNLVLATGISGAPAMPEMASAIPSDILQLHTSEYRNPAMLPPGAVFVVGSGQSGCQIAEELLRAGRRVFLATSRVGRMPRRYRGKDCTWWLHAMGGYDRLTSKLASPRARLAANPQLSGKDGGREINLHAFARDGMVLLGRMQGFDGHKFRLASDLYDNLKAGDLFAEDFRRSVDAYIRRTGVDAPQPEETDASSALMTGYQTPILTGISLRGVGIGAIVWATGHRPDLAWVDLPICDKYGFPIQSRGVSPLPGLFFLGQPWLHSARSGLLFGVGDDAAHLSQQITKTIPST